MKKILLSLIAPLAFIATLSAQISQQEADEIVLQRLEGETKAYCIYAKEEVQTGVEITISTGETLELDYLTWVYYVSYIGETNGKYLVVKESNGNLLEVNTKNDKGPNDLENWRVVIVDGDDYPIDIPFEEYSLGENCEWTNLAYDYTVIIINSDEELKQYVIGSDYPEIDFFEKTLLLANGKAVSNILEITVNSLQQLSKQGYEMKVDLFLGYAGIMSYWELPIIVDKVNEKCIIELIITVL